MSDTSPLPIPAAGEASTADPFLALLTDCESTAASLSTSVPALTSLIADLVARNNESVQQATAQLASTRSALLARKTRVLASTKHLSRQLCKRTVADFEAVETSTEQLRVWAAVVGKGGDFDCAFSVSPLLASPRLVLPPATGVSSIIQISFGAELGSVATGDGLHVVSAAGPGLKWFEPHSSNEFSVVLAQADGSVPVWLTTGDVVVELLSTVGTPAAGAWVGEAAACRSEWVRQGTLSVVYGGLSEDTPKAVLQLYVCGAPASDAAGASDWRVCVPRKRLATCAAVGAHVRTLAIENTGKGNTCGLAVSADEQWLVEGSNEGTLSVYSLPGGELVRTFGGMGQGPLRFDRLCRLCFALNGNLIVVDSGNKRLQEVTLEGVFVRLIGVGEFHDRHPFCVAVHDDVIAVGSVGGTGPRVVLFEFGVGSVTPPSSRFGVVGEAPGQLSPICTGIRFTADGSHVIVAEGCAKRLSLFTTAGVFIWCVGVGVLGGGLKDVLQSLTGEYVVADQVNHRICVFPSDGSTLIRSWGLMGTGDGQFRSPTVLAAAGHHLYVMNVVGGRVQVFK